MRGPGGKTETVSLSRPGGVRGLQERDLFIQNELPEKPLGRPHSCTDRDAQIQIPQAQ